MFNKLGFQNKVLVIFTLTFIAIISSFSFYLYMYMKMTLIQTEHTSLAPAAQKISDQIDMLYKQLDSATLGYTNYQENLDTMIEMYNTPSNNTLELLLSQSKLTHNLSAIYSLVNDLYKVVIFIPEKNIFFSYIRDEHPVSNMPFPYNSSSALNQIFTANKVFAALPAHPDYWSTSPEIVLSFVRKFSTAYFTDFGMVEIEVPYKTLELICSLDANQRGKNVLIFNEQGSLIYPYSPPNNESTNKDIQQISHYIQDHKTTSGEIKLPGHSVLFNSYKSNYTGWSVVLTDDETTFMENLKHYRTLLFLICVLILLIVLLVYYFIIKKLTKPLNQLTKTVRSVSLNNLTLGESSYSRNDFNEFRLLNRSFEHMIEKLKQSINTEYESRIREMEAHNSALQAQINPHFLFNTLNVIAVHCEDTEAEIAAVMCHRLSRMMRYSSSSSARDAALTDEMKYCVDYLELIKLHYVDCLYYEIDIPSEMNSIRLPKLTLQPFVENCINHGFDKVLPPWKIKITGKFTDAQNWELSIEDNGSGFEENILVQTMQQLSDYRHQLNKGNFIKNLQISGMGVLNTFVRLNMQFGEEFYFKINNLGDHGCRICFGVKTEEKESTSL